MSETRGGRLLDYAPPVKVSPASSKERSWGSYRPSLPKKPDDVAATRFGHAAPAAAG